MNARGIPKYAPPGITTHMAMGMYFARWARGFHKLPTVQAIQDHFGVHRATAYRWLRVYQDLNP